MSRTTHHTKSGESTRSESAPSESPASTSNAVDASKVKSLLATVSAMAGPPLALTGKDRQRAVRLRKGGEKVIPTILALSEQFGLTVPSHPTSAIAENVSKANSLVAVHKQLVLATKQVADAIFQAESESWNGATVHYTVLKRLAKTDGDLATALAPVKEFFALGRRKGVETPKGAETTTAATTEPTDAQAPATPKTPAPAPAAAPNGAPQS